jgi:hypothetical protein
MKTLLFILLMPVALLAQTPVYSSLNTERCTNIAFDDADGASSSAFRCNGVGGYKLILAADDLRETITVVAPNRREYELNLWRIHSGFSAVGTTAEWRMQGTRPKALIIRYNVSEDPDDSTKITSYLMVAKVSNTGACIVGEVPPSTRNQNVAARRMADRASSMSCM